MQTFKVLCCIVIGVTLAFEVQDDVMSRIVTGQSMEDADETSFEEVAPMAPEATSASTRVKTRVYVGDVDKDKMFKDVPAKDMKEMGKGAATKVKEAVKEALAPKTKVVSPKKFKKVVAKTIYPEEKEKPSYTKEKAAKEAAKASKAAKKAIVKKAKKEAAKPGAHVKKVFSKMLKKFLVPAKKLKMKYPCTTKKGKPCKSKTKAKKKVVRKKYGDSRDQYVTKDGKLHLGSNRRRNGAGFGRRRRTPKFKGKITAKLEKKIEKGHRLLKAGFKVDSKVKRVVEKIPKSRTAIEKLTKAGLDKEKVVDKGTPKSKKALKKVMKKAIETAKKVKAEKRKAAVRKALHLKLKYFLSKKETKAKDAKKKATKEASAKKAEAAADKKEKDAKKKAKAAKAKAAELKTKEAAAKKKEKQDKAAKKAEKAAKDEKKSKELKKKEKAAKKVAAERSSKAKIKERKAKAVLTCVTSTAASNKAGIVTAKTRGGYSMVGGGMVNHYRKWDAKSGFEEAMPHGTNYRCDTGFGPGKLTCYNRQCKTNVGALVCTTKSLRFKGSGVRDVRLPAGYTMTGGGLYNHYRKFDKKAGFEETRPNGNAWRGDMGFGWGDYTVYVRGCKAPKGHSLTCITKKSGRGNYTKVKCPSGYAATGCGVNNHYRSWNAKSGYESHFPVNNNECHCDTAFGAGDNTCYVRCCKLN